MLPWSQSKSIASLGDLFRPLDQHLTIGSILAGDTPGEVYLNSLEAPTLGLAWFHGCVFLAGEPDGPGAASVQEVLSRVLLPQEQAAGNDAFILHATPTTWEPWTDALLPGIDPIRAVRQYYAYRARTPTSYPEPPAGMELLPADASLLRRLDPAGRAALSEEMCSERVDVEAFLQRSFGLCLVQGDALVGWCLSEYNLDGRCEVGVAIMEPYQRRGLGTLMTVAFIQMALSRGIHTIGWHCWQRNIPSGALARRVGFDLIDEQPVYIYVFAPSEDGGN